MTADPSTLRKTLSPAGSSGSHGQAQASSPAEHGPSLGEAIADYRRRRRSYKDRSWSQEELAFACGTDQAHISRIESNRQRPEYSTLVRICEALELSQTESTYILALAGYRVATPLPNEHAVASALSTIAPLIDSSPYPMVLIDEGERIWYMNRFVATLWGECYGATDQKGCLTKVSGGRVVETMFDDERSRLWDEYYADADKIVGRGVALFWRACHVQPHDPELARICARLKENPKFLAQWQRVESEVNDLLFPDHHTFTITHPSLGPLRLHAWRTRAASDGRFIIINYTPVDGDTSRVLARLTERCFR